MTAPQTLIQYIPEFLDYCEVEKGLSDNTQRNYDHYLKVFVRWLETTGHERLTPGQLTVQHVWDYRLYLARRYASSTGAPLSKLSQNYYLIAFRALLHFLAERDITCLPAAKVKLARQATGTHISFLDPHEIENLLATPDTAKPAGIRDRAIMETLFSSGMRISELVSLNAVMLSALAQQDRPDQTLELPIIGKGKRVRTVFLSPRACKWIKAYLATRKDDHTPLFLCLRSRNPDSTGLSARSIQTIIARYARLAGLPKKVTPHTFRHSYATNLLTHGADLRSVQELLGHKNVSTTQIYTHVTNKRLRDVHDRFHDGPG